MISKFVEMFKNKNIRERIFYTLGIFLIFKLGTSITLPLVDVSNLQLDEQNMLYLLNMMGGGSLQNFSILALGVSPYITSSIVIELLAAGVLPKLQELREQGQKGKKSLENTTRGLTLLLGGVQAYGIIVTAMNYDMQVAGGELTFWVAAYLILVLLGGTFFVMWLGDQITVKGVGNGMSMIIFAGCISGLPTHFVQAYGVFTTGLSSATELFGGIVKFGLYCLFYLIVVIFVVFMEQAQRKIPIQYSSNSYTVRSASDVTYLPMKVNSAGVIPIIFASSVMTAPATIVGLVGEEADGWFFDLINLTEPFHGFYWGLLIFAILVVVFAFFYSNMQVNPEKIADNFSKSGAYIPGIRPGKETERYISKVLNRVTLMGAGFITLIAVLPYILQIVMGYFSEYAANLASGFGGTSIIIVVGVALETVKEIEGRMAGKDYSGLSMKNTY